MSTTINHIFNFQFSEESGSEKYGDVLLRSKIDSIYRKIKNVFGRSQSLTKEMDEEDINLSETITKFVVNATVSVADQMEKYTNLAQEELHKIKNMNEFLISKAENILNALQETIIPFIRRKKDPLVDKIEDISEYAKLQILKLFHF